MTRTIFELCEKFYQKNDADEWLNQSKSNDDGVPSQILMLDGRTYRPVSPMLKEFYAFATEWEDGIFYKTLANPNRLRELLLDEHLRYSINLTIENYHSFPPCILGDAERTALLAHDDSGEAYL